MPTLGNITMVSNPANPPRPPLAVGDDLAAATHTVTRAGIDAYRAVSGDHNRIHYDDDFAAATRFGGVIAHGMLTLAMASEIMAASYGAAWLSGGALRVRFRDAARPGDRLVATGKVTKSEPDGAMIAVTCNIVVRNADTDTAILTGTAAVRIAATPDSGLRRNDG